MFKTKSILIVLSISIVFLSFLYFIYPLINNSLDNFFGDVLQSSSSSDSFGIFQQAQVYQYPIIRYSDSFNVPFQTRFSNYRNSSTNNTFNHFLCRGNQNNCSGYSQNPKFIRLNFGTFERLVLFNFYGLYSINDTNNSASWESAMLDRFRVSGTTVPDCKHYYDPDTVLPIKQGDTFYLFSKISSINSGSCLQFYDRKQNSPSFSRANAKLYLGFEVNSDGKLNRGYNRSGSEYRTLNPTSEGPFGPTPQTAIYYATAPMQDLLGCAQFDSGGRCIKAKGIVENNYLLTPGTPIKVCVKYGPEVRTTVERWNRCVNCSGTINTGLPWPYDTEYVSDAKTCVMPPSFPKCSGGLTQSGGMFNEYLGTYEKVEKPCIEEKITGYKNAKFQASYIRPEFSNFENVNFNPISWNLTVPTPSVESVTYREEFSNYSTNKPLNYTNNMNKSIFTTNKYLFEVKRDGTKIILKRYELKTNEYNIGGTSNIDSGSLKTIEINSRNSNNTKFSLNYFKNDIFIMASGSDLPDFYRLKDLNNSSSYTAINLNSELTSKLPSATSGISKSFGIVENNNVGKIFIVTDNKLFWSNISEEPEIVAVSGYKNFEFNGNVFSKENLTTGFMFTAPASKFVGNYVTSQDFTSNLKFLNKSTLSFNYPNSLLSSLINFSSFNGSSYEKFNFLYNDVNFTENVPLSDSQYFTFSNPTSGNKFEIIYVSEGKGVKLDLTNQNIIKNFSKYIIINSDKNNRSRINFYLNCSDASYSLICSGTKFNFKGAILGHFYISGNANSTIDDKRFIRIHENADILINLSNELRTKKYGNTSSTLLFVQYE